MLLFILFTHDIWFGLEDERVLYTGDSTLLAFIPSPNMSYVLQSFYRDLSLFMMYFIRH